MHSRICQLSQKPIDKSDYITEDMFYDDFVGTVGDYVQESPTGRKEDIEWLMAIIEDYGAIYNSSEESILFPIGFKENYFKESYEKLKEAVQNMSLEQFASDSIIVSTLKLLIDSKYGFYIYTTHWQTLDNFVRCELKEGEKYYIGGILDYHF